jgi:hypothetical protein
MILLIGLGIFAILILIGVKKEQEKDEKMDFVSFDKYLALFVSLKLTI